MEGPGVEDLRRRLDEAGGFGDVYEVVKESVKRSLGEYRVGMMLYLDDLPLRVGAYHPVGTNSIVMNRALLRIVERAVKSKRVVNAFIYSLLLHEYLHALGYMDERRVRPLVYQVSRQCLGEDHIATRLARIGPWSLLRDLPLDTVEAPRRVVEIVKDFEKMDRGYIV